MTQETAKINAALGALQFVEDGMVVGLGTGSTASHFVRLLGERVNQGLRIQATPTSEATRRLAEQVGIPLLDLDQCQHIDVCIDGADEADHQFRLIKGGGGALLREKIIAALASHMIVIADNAKLVAELGAFPLPVEVTAFGFTHTARQVFAAMRATNCPGHEVVLRTLGNTGKPFITDGGHYILDCHCQTIPSPEELADRLSRIAGVMEHGLFLNIARTMVIGTPERSSVRER